MQNQQDILIGAKALKWHAKQICRRIKKEIADNIIQKLKEGNNLDELAEFSM